MQDKIRWQIVIRSQSPAKMRTLVNAALTIYNTDKGRAGVHLTLDMDPLDLL
ncbi:MAG: hypothetical protein ACOCVL_03815 [Candidatus Sumerlaeota bacterium]